jgi:hypothetical protein
MADSWVDGDGVMGLIGWLNVCLKKQAPSRIENFLMLKLINIRGYDNVKEKKNKMKILECVSWLLCHECY